MQRSAANLVPVVTFFPLWTDSEWKVRLLALSLFMFLSNRQDGERCPVRATVMQKLTFQGMAVFDCYILLGVCGWGRHTCIWVSIWGHWWAWYSHVEFTVVCPDCFNLLLMCTVLCPVRQFELTNQSSYIPIITLSFLAGSSVPNKILFLSNLPSETNEMMLKMLFEQWAVCFGLVVTTVNPENFWRWEKFGGWWSKRGYFFTLAKFISAKGWCMCTRRDQLSGVAMHVVLSSHLTNVEPRLMD